MKSMIVAMGKNREIGADQDMPWGRAQKTDMAYFKRKTLGKSVIMGRKTLEAMGDKPLPNRQNIVVTRTPTGIQGVLSAFTLEAAYDLAQYEPVVIGGGQMYAQAIGDADKLYVTEVDAEFPEATVFFPEIDKDIWHETSREHHEADEKNAYAFDFVVYEKLAK